MALNDAATLVIDTANYLLAPSGTALPDDLRAPAVPWDSVGHTSLEDIFAASSEGGEATVLGTLQKKSLRTKYSPRQETFQFTVQQFDEDSLKLYFGSNMVDVTSGGHDLLGVHSSPTPTVMAIAVVFIDGDNTFAFYAPKAEIFRGDDLALSDTENLAGMPLSVKPMQDGSNAWTYAITPLGVVAP